MAEENQVAHNVIPGEVAPDIKTETSTESTEQDTATTTTIEDRAREQGWRPKEEFDGDPAKWVSAETFVAKGELIDRIEALGKKLKDSEKTINMLKEHHAKVKEVEFKKAVDFLKSQKKAALEDGDVDKIIEIDDKIAQVRETQKAQKAQEAVNAGTELHPDFASWVSENKWYEKNSEMRADADAFGEAYARNNPNKTPQEVLEYVTTKIKKTYKEAFENPNRSRPSGVEGGGTRQGASRDTFTLTEEEAKVMNTFIRNGVMTKEEYIQEVKRMRGA